MLISIFSNDFFIVQILYVIELAFWISVFVKLKSIIKPCKINDKYVTFVNYLFLFVLIGISFILFHFHEYYNDQSYVQNGQITPFKISIEVVTCILAFLYTRIDYKNVHKRFLLKHKIILTEKELDN